jgi:hypothetical protein
MLRTSTTSINLVLEFLDIWTMLSGIESTPMHVYADPSVFRKYSLMDPAQVLNEDPTQTEDTEQHEDQGAELPSDTSNEMSRPRPVAWERTPARNAAFVQTIAKESRSETALPGDRRRGTFFSVGRVFILLWAE